MFDKNHKLPEFKVLPNRNGYEIRADILGYAKDLVETDFTAKFNGWKLTTEKTHDGQLKTVVEMPSFPGVEEVLKTAERMYEFVSKGVVPNLNKDEDKLKK